MYQQSKKPALKAPVITTPVKGNNVLRIPQKREQKELPINFFVNATYSSIMIKIGDISFGIRKNGAKFDGYSTGIISTGDNEYIRLIQGILRTKVKELKEGETYEIIAADIQTKGGTATSIRIFHSRIDPTEKPVREKKEKPVPKKSDNKTDKGKKSYIHTK